MSKGRNIEQFISLFDTRSKQHIKVITHWVKAAEIDWENKTMTAIGITDGLEFYDVLLGFG